MLESGGYSHSERLKKEQNKTWGGTVARLKLSVLMSLKSSRIPFLIKLLYGSGDWGISSIGMLRSIFYALYLTDVVGRRPRGVPSFQLAFSPNPSQRNR